MSQLARAIAASRDARRGAVFALAAGLVLPLSPGRAAADDCSAPPPAIEGVNRTNLMWRKDSGAILTDIASAGIKSVRLSFSPPYADTLRTIGEAHDRGLSVLLSVGLGQDAFRAKGIRRRPGGSGLFSAHRMSTLDIDRFRSVLGDFIGALDRTGQSLAAIEIGNEINWADFNGDFPIRPRGKGRAYKDSADLAADSEAEGVLAGFDRYAEAVVAARELLRDSTGQRGAVLISGGLFTGRETWTVRSGGTALSQEFAMALLARSGVIDAVDAVGVHLYPTPSPDRSDRMAGLQEQASNVTAACLVGLAGAKPCWFTEWGFTVDGDACTLDDTERLANLRAFRRALSCLSGAVAIDATYLYDWDDGKDFSLHRCGRDLPSVKFFSD